MSFGKIAPDEIIALFGEDEYIPLDRLSVIPQYTYGEIVSEYTHYGYDLPPTNILSAWYRDMCACCMKPVVQVTSLSLIIPRMLGGGEQNENYIVTCEGCARRGSSRIHLKTYDGRPGCYWDGMPWNGDCKIRPKYAHQKEPQQTLSSSRQDIEKLVKHAINLDRGRPRR